LSGSVKVAVLVVAALLVSVWWQRRRRYRGVFRARATRDDRLVCSGPHTEIEVSATADGFEPPPGLLLSGRTVFLELNVRATAPVLLRDPFIQASMAGAVSRQYFERAARGRRLVDISALFRRPDEEGRRRVSLRGSSLEWASAGRLVLFDPPPIEGADTLVLAPHPDDAEIAAFGVYATRRSWIVTVTAGERGTADFSGVLPSGAPLESWYARLRLWDSLTIPQLGGVPSERCLSLVYPDGQLLSMRRRPEEGFQIGCEDKIPRATLRSANRWPGLTRGGSDCTWRGLVEELGEIIDRIRPAVIVAPHPVLDTHPDHVSTSVALEEALRTRSARPILLLYSVHRPEARIHPFGPASAVASPPPWNDDVPVANALYSHALSPEVRQAKYFAIAAGHDLRTYSAGEVPTIRAAAVAVKRVLSALVSSTGIDPVSFYRRAPRPNELYYVASVELLTDLVRRATSSQDPVT
jgi:LmbE family N-acetylglucosaminyl deacetylase